MDDIDYRIYPRESISRLEALELEQGTDNLFIVCVLAFLFSLCSIDLSLVWAVLALLALRWTKPFLRKVEMAHLHAFFRLVCGIWAMMGFVLFLHWMTTFWLSGYDYWIDLDQGLVLKAIVTVGMLLSRGLYLLVLILFYRYFEVLFSVFYRRSAMGRAKTYLIIYCLANVAVINFSGIVFLMSVESAAGVKLVPLRDVYEQVFWLAGPVGAILVIAAIIILYAASLVVLTLFFLRLRRVFPYIRALDAGVRGAEET
jgi:hypothetical protein